MEQMPLFTSNHRQISGAGREAYGDLANSAMNKLGVEDRAVHSWYRFVLSFPPHLVDEYIARFKLDGSSRLLDPFCGTGTTLVQAKKRGIPSVGIEANPVASFASRVKIDWRPDPVALKAHARRIYENVSEEFKSSGISDEPLLRFISGDRNSVLRVLDPEQEKLLLKDSISALPLQDARTEGQAERAVRIMDDLEPDEEDFPAQGAGKQHRSQVMDGCRPTRCRRQGQHQKRSHVKDPDHFQIQAQQCPLKRGTGGVADPIKDHQANADGGESDVDDFQDLISRHGYSFPSAGITPGRCRFTAEL